MMKMFLSQQLLDSLNGFVLSLFTVIVRKTCSLSNCLQVSSIVALNDH